VRRFQFKVRCGSLRGRYDESELLFRTSCGKLPSHANSVHSALVRSKQDTGAWLLPEETTAFSAILKSLQTTASVVSIIEWHCLIADGRWKVCERLLHERLDSRRHFPR